MIMSPFFRNLHSAYQAELDDLTQDSEGKDVLRRRLADKRKEIGFLVQMMELSPEMVAVVFHQGFRFTAPAVLERLLALDGVKFTKLPSWKDLSQAITLAPWADSLAQVVLREPLGEWFMAVAVGLEYLQSHPAKGSYHNDSENTNGSDDGHGDDDGNNTNPLSADDATDHHSNESREESRENWLSDQGFERKT